jgi:hypothetical protein
MIKLGPRQDPLLAPSNLKQTLSELHMAKVRAGQSMNNLFSLSMNTFGRICALFTMIQQSFKSTLLESAPQGRMDGWIIASVLSEA